MSTRALAAVIVSLIAVATAVALPGRRQTCRTSRPNEWAGVYPTILTPWNCDCTVDEAALETELNYTICGGVRGVLVLGTIGEGVQAGPAARAQVLAVTSRVTAGRVPFIVGIHTCDLELARLQLNEAKSAGAAAVLVKYRGRPRASAAEVLCFFESLTAEASLPIFYYHLPADTGLRLSPCEVGQIVRLPGVAGAKISTLDLREFREIRACGGCDKAYFNPSAMALTQFLDAGGDGAICPEAVILPGPAACIHKHWQSGCLEQARETQKQMFVLAPLLVKGPSTEYMACRRVMMTQDLELPLRVRDSEPQARLKATLNGIGVPMSAKVSCGLTPLRFIDEPVVNVVVRKLGRRFGDAR